MANETTETIVEQPTVTQPAQPNGAPTSAPADNESVELTVNDLAAIKQILDVATARGAFRPQEMVAVGTTYGKLEKFLNVVAQQQKESSNQ